MPLGEKMSKEKTLSSQLIYDGNILQLYRDDVELEDGKTSKREYVRHSGGACVLAVDDEENIFLVSQFRYPYGEVMLEIPAGKRNRDEDPMACALRELEEECGLATDRAEKFLEIYPTVAYSNEHIYVYLAHGLKATHAHLDEGEVLNVRRLPFKQALEKVLNMEIRDSKTVAAILKYAYLNKIGL